MKILTIDIGTGTQDIFLYDSRLDIENGFKLILPSPTMIIHNRIQEATRQRQPILLTGVMMGGGPSAWAVEAHLKAGLPVYATPAAARTFNDELEKVEKMGVRVVSDEEAVRLSGSTLTLELRDLDLPAIGSVFNQFGVTLKDLSAVAVAVFDHGDAPPGMSDRQFRFDYLDGRIRSRVSEERNNPLSAFACLREDIPAIMTRLQAVAGSAGTLECPLVVMDTAPAAVLGATFDPVVAASKQKIIANVGNFHTLAFRIGEVGRWFWNLHRRALRTSHRRNRPEQTGIPASPSRRWDTETPGCIRRYGSWRTGVRIIAFCASGRKHLMWLSPVLAVPFSHKRNSRVPCGPTSPPHSGI